VAAPLAVLAAVLIVAGLAALLWNGRNSAAPTTILSEGSHNAAAVAYYQSGLHAWQTRSPSGLRRAIGDFTNAIRADPHYAQPSMGLANTYNLMCEYTTMSCSEAYGKAAASAKRAISLDQSLAGAHAALGFDDFYGQRDIIEARREFSRAIALDPRDATTHHWYATVLMSIGEFGHARSEIDKAAELDSESAAILADKAVILFFAGKPQQAIKLLKQVESDQPFFASPHLYLSNIDLVAGDDAGYLREMKLLADTRHDVQLASLSTAGRRGLETHGHVGMLRSLLAARQAQYAKGKVSAYSLSQIHALLGEKKQALAYLRISIARKEPELVGAQINPLYAPLRDMPEFGRLLASAGFVGARPPSRIKAVPLREGRGARARLAL
jgi:Tfp pilus assembly protein PilF